MSEKEWEEVKAYVFPPLIHANCHGSELYWHFGLWRHLVAAHMLFRYFLFACSPNYSCHLCLVSPVTCPI